MKSRRPIRPPIPPQRDNDTRLPELPTMIEPDEETLDGIVSQFGPGDIQIKIYKLEKGQREYCATLTNPAEANEESVKALGFGAGKYVLHVVIDGEFRKAIPIAIAASSLAIVPQAQQTTESAMMKFMADRLAMLEQLLLRGANQEREPMSQIVAAVAQVQALAGANAPKELPTETLLRCIELGKSLQAGTATDDSIMGVIKEIAKDAAPGLIQAFMASRGGGVPVQANAGLEGARVVNPPEVKPVQVLSDDQQIKMGIVFLKRKCIDGSDPNLYAYLIADNCNDEKYNKLIQRILKDDFSAFITIDPEIGNPPFREWFESVYNRIRSEFAGQDTLAVDTGGTNGHAVDTSKNGATGKRGGK